MAGTSNLGPEMANDMTLHVSIRYYKILYIYNVCSMYDIICA